MPIDFRTYTDPGVYIDTIDPPVVAGINGIEPTVVAIVGEAPDSRTAVESAVLVNTGPTQLSTLGGDPSTLNVKDRLLGTQYVSAAVGSLNADVTYNGTSFAVNYYGNVVTPTTPFPAYIEDEEVSVTGISGSENPRTWTVTRAQNSTTGVAHLEGQVLNVGTYGTGAWVSSLATPVTSTQTSVTATASPVFQVVTITGGPSGGTFTLTYNGQTTGTIAYNAAASAVDTALEALSNIGTDEVVVSGANGGPYTIQFLGTLALNTVMLTADGAGLTGGTNPAVVVTRRGVAASTFLDVEGERMLVSAASVVSNNSQTLTLVRGVAGTTAKVHGAVDLYQNSGGDYRVRAGVGNDGVIDGVDDTISLTLLGTRIAHGTAVDISLSSTDAAQYSAALFDSFDAVRNRYGVPLNTDGTVNSPLTLAAQLAFANGATQVMLVQVESSDWTTALGKLAYEQTVNVVVPLSGTTNVINATQTHVNQMSNQGLLRRAFVGLNGLAIPAPTYSDFVTKAQQLHDARVSLVAPGRFKVDNGTETPTIVGGFYGAAAVAGLHAGMAPQEPLTRKQVYGFVGLDDQESSSNIYTMQSKGVLVVWEDRLGRLIVKHGLTTDMTSVYTRELTVIVGRDRLRDFIMDTLENGALIGSAQTENTPALVLAGVTSSLEEATRQGLIYDYTDLAYRIPAEDPTVIEVRFAYRPTLPLNYIHVQFSINTSTTEVEFQSITENTV